MGPSCRFSSETSTPAQRAPVVALSLGQFAAAAIPAGTVLVMTGNERLAMVLIGISSIIAIAGELVAVRFFGILGVAAFSGGGTAAQAVLMAYFVRRRLGILPFASFAPRNLKGVAQELLLAVKSKH